MSPLSWMRYKPCHDVREPSVTSRKRIETGQALLRMKGRQIKRQVLGLPFVFLRSHIEFVGETLSLLTGIRTQRQVDAELMPRRVI